MYLEIKEIFNVICKIRNFLKSLVTFFCIILPISFTSNTFSQTEVWEIETDLTDYFTSSVLLPEGTEKGYEVSLNCYGNIVIVSPTNEISQFDHPYIGYSGISHTFEMKHVGLYQITETYSLNLSCKELEFSYKIDKENTWQYYNSSPNIVLFQNDMWVDSYEYYLSPNDAFNIIGIRPLISRPSQAGLIEIEAKRDIYEDETIQVLIYINAKWHKNSSILSIGNIGDNVTGLVNIYNLRQLTTSMFNAIRDCNELKYILVQIILHPDLIDIDEIELDRMVQLSQAGKRIVIQMWFGPHKHYNWSYCGYPNIAMQQEVRDYLFYAVDKTIDRIGPKNIYGIHMLEEDGNWCVDIDQPGYWWKNKGWVYSGYEDGDPYNNFSNLKNLYDGDSSWFPKVPNINQYNSFFKSETNLDMDNMPNQDPLSGFVLNRWMARRLWAGAHIEFLQHIAEKYPTIKRFIWASQAYDGFGSGIEVLNDIVDGYISNSYRDTQAMHNSFSGIKKLLPKAEFLAILEDSLDAEIKDLRVATVYLNGASAIGFHGTTQNQETWQTSQNIWKKISVLPILRVTPPQVDGKVLIVTSNTDSGYSNSRIMLPFFKLPICIHTRNAAGLDLSQYKIIVLHYGTSYRNDYSILNYNMTGFGPDDNQLKNWVWRGGILVITAKEFLEANQFFVVKEGIGWTASEWDYCYPNGIYFECSADIAAKYNIDKLIQMLVCEKNVIWGNGISHDNFHIGGVAEYGYGKIVILPIFHNDSFLLDEQTCDEDRVKWIKAAANYIADVIRGVAMVHDTSGSLSNEIVSKSEPFGLLLDSENNNIKVKVIFDILDQDFSCSIYKDGNLILGK